MLPRLLIKAAYQPMSQRIPYSGYVQ